jgi:hypothetical protein
MGTKVVYGSDTPKMTRQEAERIWKPFGEVLKLENPMDEFIQLDTVEYLFIWAMLEGARIEREGKS